MLMIKPTEYAEVLFLSRSLYLSVGGHSQDQHAEASFPRQKQYLHKLSRNHNFVTYKPIKR